MPGLAHEYTSPRSRCGDKEDEARTPEPHLPLHDRVESALPSHVADHDGTLGTSEIRPCQLCETILPRDVPQLESDLLIERHVPMELRKPAVLYTLQENIFLSSARVTTVYCLQSLG